MSTHSPEQAPIESKDVSQADPERQADLQQKDSFEMRTEGFSEPQKERLRSFTQAREAGNADPFSDLFGFSQERWDRADSEMKTKLLVNGLSVVKEMKLDASKHDSPEEQRFLMMCADEAEGMLHQMYANVEQRLDKDAVEKVLSQLHDESDSGADEGFTSEESQEFERRSSMNNQLEAYGDIIQFTDEDWRKASFEGKKGLVERARENVAHFRSQSTSKLDERLAAEAEKILKNMDNANTSYQEWREKQE